MQLGSLVKSDMSNKFQIKNLSQQIENFKRNLNNMNNVLKNLTDSQGPTHPVPNVANKLNYIESKYESLARNLSTSRKKGI